MKQVRCGEDVKKIDSEGTRGRGERCLSRSLLDSPRGDEIMGRNDYPSFSKSKLAADIQSNHYILFVPFSSEERRQPADTVENTSF